MEKRIVLFGAGDAGRQACDALGKGCIECFIDNHKHGQTVLGIPVFDFEYLRKNHSGLNIIVTSFDCWREISNQLEYNNISEYLIWQRYYIEYMPSFNTCTKKYRLPFSSALFLHRFDVYSRIAVYAYDPIADLVLFLLSAYGATKSIRWLFKHKPPFYGSRKLRRLLGEHADPAKHFDAILDAVDCLVVAVRRQDISLFDVDMMDYATFPIVDFYDPAPFFVPKRGITEFKNSHRGKRCFIIGNGPSLRIEDLNTLHRNKEITFGCNKIYLAFEKTAWRPDFFAITDTRTFDYNREDILALDLPCKLFAGVRCDVPETGECVRLNHCWEPFFPNVPRFSDNPEVCLYGAGSVVYEICLQMAAYMGFGEIYLLGVDNTMHADFRRSNHFTPDYITSDEADYIENSGMRVYQPYIDAAFKKAESHSRMHGYRIFNATRGGRLEAFERVCFNDLF